MTDPAYAVRALLPLRLRRISESERQEGLPALPAVDLPSAVPVDSSDPLGALAQRVSALERKIDTLVDLLLRKEQQEARRAAASVELKMDGLTFSWPEKLTPGQGLEVELVLGLMPPTELRCIATVERCCASSAEDAQAAYDVLARFDCLGDAEADVLHRYMLTAQRRSRRSRRSRESKTVESAGR